MSKRKDSGGASVPPGGGDTPCRDHGDTRHDWPAKPAWAASPGGSSDASYDAASDQWLAGLAKNLHEFLVLTGWGGKQRKAGTIRVFAEEGRWKACLNDNEGQRYAFVSGETLLGLLESVEKGLEANRLDWRPNKKWK